MSVSGKICDCRHSSMSNERGFEFKSKIPCEGKVSKEQSSEEEGNGFYFSEVEVI